MTMRNALLHLVAAIACIALTIACAVYVSQALTPPAATLGTLALGTTHLSGNLEIGGTLATTGVTTHTGATTFTGSQIANGLAIHSAASITPTNGGIITPTTSTIILTPAGAVTPTLAACTTSGTRLTLYNANNAAIVLADSGTLNATAALSVGQYDTLELVCIATVWYEIALSAN